MQATRENFRPSVQSSGSPRGRSKQSKIIEFKLTWSIIRIQKYICEIYSRVQLESVGFCFGKCAKDKKITILTINTLEELLNKVPRGVIIIISNRDLSCSDYAITNNANIDEHNRIIRRYSLQLNFRQESNNESDDNNQGNQIIEEMLRLYDDETIIQKKIKVTFKELDYGENRSVIPFLSLSKIRKGLEEKFTIKHEILLEDLFHFLTSVGQRLIYKAKSFFEELNDFEKERMCFEKNMLLGLFTTYAFLENPKKSEIKDQLSIIAENVLCIESYNFIKKIKDGIPLFCEKFFTDLTDSKVDFLFEQAANPNKVITVITVLKTVPEELNNIQIRVFYFFKTYIKNLTQEDLSKMLLFITASLHLPKITISFKTFAAAHTCLNVLELSTISSSYQELKTHFDSILGDKNSF
ncbi:hypothetical protein P5V15_001366 [Pogonomyrmex californicus]